MKLIKNGTPARWISCMLLTVLLGTSVTGCGSDGEQQENGPETAEADGQAFIAEEIALPHEQIMVGAVNQNTLYYLNQEGSGEETTRQNIYRLDMSAEAQEPAVIALAPEEGQTVGFMKADQSGGLHLLAYEFDEADGSTVSDLVWLKSDEEGNASGSVSLLDFYEENGQQSPVAMEVDSAGNLYLAMGSTVYVLDPEGNSLFEAVCDGMVTHLCRNDAGKVYVVWYVMEENLSVGMADVDTGMKGLGTRYDLSLSEILLGAGFDGTGKLLMASTSGVLAFDMENNTSEEKFQWAPLDVVSDYYGLFFPLADGRCLWLGREIPASEAEGEITSTLMLIRPLKEGEAVQEAKETLTFGGLSIFIDSTIRGAIVEFNRTSPDYRIEIVEYGTEDVQAGLEQLSADIVSGSGPDIMALPMGYSLNLYAGKGVLEDLNPYLDGDTSVSRDDLQTNILEAFETDGQLYGFPVSYVIYTVMGKTSLLGEGNAWTLDELIAYVDRNGGDNQVFLTAGKSGALNFCLEANKDSLINWEDAEQGLDREMFIKILEFANRFQPDEQAAALDINTITESIREDQIQLFETAVTSMATHQVYQGMFGEPVTYVGFPSESGNGTLASSTALIAVSSQCSDKEAAWQFVSSMLTEEFQEDPLMVMGFPIRKSGLEAQIETAMETTYTTDAEGNQQEESHGAFTLGSSQVEIYAAKEEEVQMIRDLIENVDTVQESDSQISAIISEEAQIYFAGGKTAEETADVVENRLELYLKEGM